MEQSLLIELIKTLNSEDKANILQLAHLGFINNGRMRAHIGELLKFCFDINWKSAEQFPQKFEVYNCVFPQQIFVEGKLEKVMVDAHKLIKNYMLIKNYLRDPNTFQQDFDFAQLIKSQNLTSRYQNLLARLEKDQHQQKTRSTDYYWNQYQLEHAKSILESEFNQKKGDLNIKNTFASLEVYHLLASLKLFNGYLLQLKITIFDTSPYLQSKIENFEVPTEYIQAVPALKISFAIFNILKHQQPSNDDLNQIITLINTHEQSLSAADIAEYFAYLRNICTMIAISEPANEEIHSTLFEIYKDNLSRGYIHCDGKIHPSRYLGITSIGLRVQQYEWTLNFIEQFKTDIIGDSETHDIYKFIKAKFLFSVGEFEKCLDIIPATSQFVDYLLIGKRLELQCYYELGSQLFSYKLDSFKMFLSRTSPKLLSNTLRQMNIEFANHLTQISSSIPGDRKRAAKLVARLEEKKQIMEWSWLLAKAKAIGKQK